MGGGRGRRPVPASKKEEPIGAEDPHSPRRKFKADLSGLAFSPTVAECTPPPSSSSVTSDKSNRQFSRNRCIGSLLRHLQSIGCWLASKTGLSGPIADSLRLIDSVQFLIFLLKGPIMSKSLQSLSLIHSLLVVACGLSVYSSGTLASSCGDDQLSVGCRQRGVRALYVGTARPQLPSSGWYTGLFR